MIRIKTIENFLSKNECTEIIKKFSDTNLEVACYHNKNNELVVDKKIRNSEIYFIEDAILKNKILNELKTQINIKGFEFIDLEKIQFTKYGINGHYSWHTDSSPNNPNNNRFYSIVIPLNDNYENGELLIKDIDDSIHTMEKKIGNMYIFLSSLLHTVTPVNVGIRYSLVCWIALKKIEDYKKTLL